MSMLALVWGILAATGTFVALVPCLGWLNWVAIPFSFLGVILGVAALVTAKPQDGKGAAIAGVVLSAVALVVGGIRLILGGGVL